MSYVGQSVLMTTANAGCPADFTGGIKTGSSLWETQGNRCCQLGEEAWLDSSKHQEEQRRQQGNRGWPRLGINTMLTSCLECMQRRVAVCLCRSVMCTHCCMTTWQLSCLWLQPFYWPMTVLRDVRMFMQCYVSAIVHLSLVLSWCN